MTLSASSKELLQGATITPTVIVCGVSRTPALYMQIDASAQEWNTQWLAQAQIEGIGWQSGKEDEQILGMRVGWNDKTGQITATLSAGGILRGNLQDAGLDGDFLVRLESASRQAHAMAAGRDVAS